jgi:NADPH-dependent 2,4-dienoyl-CoA reductase/sulfur reductase-like enzyme
MKQIVIVGAGPAGIAAAAALAPSAATITVIDEAPRAGGQIHRMPTPGLALDMHTVLADGHAAYRQFHATVNSLRGRIQFRPDTLAWNVYGGELHVASSMRLDSIRYDSLILATGAIDRVMPVAGWTLPGVFTLGAAQVLLKSQGCLLGDSVVFCGSSPLLYLAALQYLRVGGRVAAVIDSTRFVEKLRAIPGMCAVPNLLVKGLRYLARLRQLGVRIIHSAHVEAIEGQHRVEALTCRTTAGVRHRIACDAIAYGHGLRAETQLAELAGCELRYDPIHRQYLPAVDEDGRAGQAIYLAGDGRTIGGADAAVVSGTLAAQAVAADLGLSIPPIDAPAQRRKLHHLYHFQRAMAGAFAWPRHAVTSLPDEVPVCRCENVTAGEIRASLRLPLGFAELNRVKAATRCGMGRCQGRMCGAAAAELTAAVLGRADAPLDRLRAQPPVKPMPVAIAGVRA